jgi:hypothetical protein
MGRISRYNEYKDIDFDRLIRDIKSGKVKAGKYAHLVKTKGDYKLGRGDNNK